MKKKLFRERQAEALNAIFEAKIKQVEAAAERLEKTEQERIAKVMEVLEEIEEKPRRRGRRRSVK